MEYEQRTTARPKYVSIKKAALYFGCSEDAIRDLYREDPHTYKGVKYIGGYCCCLEDIEKYGDTERVRRNTRPSLESETLDTLPGASETPRIQKSW
jgi:hypothetical protein